MSLSSGPPGSSCSGYVVGHRIGPGGIHIFRMSAPSGAVFFEASHWPTGHMTRSQASDLEKGMSRQDFAASQFCSTNVTSSSSDGDCVTVGPNSPLKCVRHLLGETCDVVSATFFVKSAISK